MSILFLVKGQHISYYRSRLFVFVPTALSARKFLDSVNVSQFTHTHSSQGVDECLACMPAGRANVILCQNDVIKVIIARDSRARLRQRVRPDRVSRKSEDGVQSRHVGENPC